MVVVGDPGHPNQCPYLDCWQDLVLSWQPWLKVCIEENCKVTRARVTASPKRWPKTEEPILSGEPEGTPLPYAPLYPSLPPVPLAVLAVETPSERVPSPEASPSLAPPGTLDVTGSPGPPVLTSYAPPRRLLEDQASGDGPSLQQHQGALQMPSRETRGPIYYDQEGQNQGGQRVFVYQPFTTTDLLNWKHHTPSYMEKPQAVIELMQSLIQTYKPTQMDCCQLLMTIFNTEEHHQITQVALKWLEGNAPAGMLDTQA